MSIVTTFNRRVPYPVRLLSVVVAGLLLYGSLESAMAIAGKMSGGAVDCAWPRTALFGLDLLRLEKWRSLNSFRLSLQSEDATWGIQQFSTIGGRTFWIKKAGSAKNGKDLLSYLLSDHSWMAEINGPNHVKKGDVVLDCGAHVGVFTD